jgi:23S rRNA pseudouridine2605 synthase
VKLDDGRAAPAQLRVVATRRDVSEIDLTLHEGRNRQVRRMFEELGHPVIELVRLRFGPLTLGTLEPGATRDATPKEMSALRAIANEAKHHAGPEGG